MNQFQRESLKNTKKMLELKDQNKLLEKINIRLIKKNKRLISKTERFDYENQMLKAEIEQ